MATVITGRTLTVEIDGDIWSPQVTEVTLTPSQTVTQYTTLSSSAATVGPVTWELAMTAYQDWTAATPLFEAMVTAAAAGTPVAFEVAVTGGGTWTGNLIPVYPTVGGSADSALEATLTFPVDGDVTFTP